MLAKPVFEHSKILALYTFSAGLLIYLIFFPNRYWQKMLALNRYGGAEKVTKRSCITKNYVKCVIFMMLFVLMGKKNPMRCRGRNKFCHQEIHLFICERCENEPYIFITEI